MYLWLSEGNLMAPVKHCTIASLPVGSCRPQWLNLMSGHAISSPAEAILGHHLTAKGCRGPPSRRLQPAGDASQALRLVGARPRLEVISLLGSHGQRPSLPAARVRLHDLGDVACHVTHPGGGAVTRLQFEVGPGRLWHSPCVRLQAVTAEELAHAVSLSAPQNVGRTAGCVCSGGSCSVWGLLPGISPWTQDVHWAATYQTVALSSSMSNEACSMWVLQEAHCALHAVHRCKIALDGLPAHRCQVPAGLVLHPGQPPWPALQWQRQTAAPAGWSMIDAAHALTCSRDLLSQAA